MSTLYTIQEVLKHNTESDCWIIINNIIYNVTNFLNKHPGGVSSIAKVGRAGNDVTFAFEQIGHSQSAYDILKSMQIGVVTPVILSVVDEDLDCNSNSHYFSIDNEERVGLIRDCSTSDNDNYSDNNHINSTVEVDMEVVSVIDDPEREQSSLWHANRRKEILRDHPEVAELIGSNPWTCGIGLATVIIHCGTCIYVQGQQVSWWYMFVLAYTIGALCKMCQFAVNHDICHGTAGSWLCKSNLLKRCSMQLFTLPCVGGTMHIYYENQHLGHHTSLGSQSLSDMGGGGGKHSNNKNKSKDKDVQEPESASEPQAMHKLSSTTTTTSTSTLMPLEELRKVMFMPEGDGDLLAVGNFCYGRILKQWRQIEKYTHNTHNTNIDTQNSQNRHTYIPRVYISDVTLATIHRSKILKITCSIILHLLHHGLLSYALLHTGLLLPLISLPIFIFPEYFVEHWYKLAKRYMKDTSKMSKMSSEYQRFLISFMINMSASQGLHVWCFVCLNIYLLFCARGIGISGTSISGTIGISSSSDTNWTYTWGSVAKGFMYLYLSELFLYGFAFHPYMGYVSG